MWNPHCGYYALMFDTVDLSFNSFEGSSNFSTSARCLQKLAKYIFLSKLKINFEVWAYCKVWTEFPLWRPKLTKSFGLNISEWAEGKSILDVGYCKKLSQPLCLEADRQQAIVGRRLYFTKPDQQHDKYKERKGQRQRQRQRPITWQI